MTTPEQARKLAKFQGKDDLPWDVRDALRSLADQLEELQADAERYRWLKDAPWLDTPIERTIALQKNALWDSAIDAARKAK